MAQGYFYTNSTLLFEYLSDKTLSAALHQLAVYVEGKFSSLQLISKLTTTDVFMLLLNNILLNLQ